MEIEAQDSLPSPPLKKKSRSPSPNKESAAAAAAEGDRKRRKHHHHHRRHHHRYHRRHSKKEKGRDEENEKKEMIVEELEEGEIIEEGEIELWKPVNLAISGEDPLCNPDCELKALDYNSDALPIENRGGNAHDSMHQESSVKHCEILGRKIEAVPVYRGANETNGRISLILGESEVSEDIHTERKESTDKDYDAAGDDLRSEGRSVSPFPRDNIYAIKQKDREGDNETNSDHSPGRHRHGEQMAPSPSHRWCHSKDHLKHRSKLHDHDYDCSRVGRRDQHKVSCEMNKGHKERSSHSKHDYREDIHGNYDRQKEMDRGFRKESKESERGTSYSRHDRQEHGHSEHARERDTSKKHHWERDRNSSISSRDDRQKHGHSEHDRERDTSKKHHREMDRSSSISGRHDGQEHGHSGCDRERDTNKNHHCRERDRSFSISSRHDRREHGYSERDRERDTSKKHSREGGRSSSISSRHDRCKRKGDDSGSIPIRDRNAERPRDVSKERYGESDGLRDTNRDRERDRYGYDRYRSWFKDWEVNLENRRRHGRQIERDEFNSRDKQRGEHSKYDEWDQRRGRTRTKEVEHTKDRHNSQERREESSREEDEEDYQDRIEQQLAKQDEEDLEKIKEESRKKRQAIMEKYRQQQPQKHVESPLDDHPEAENDSSVHKDKQLELDINNYNIQAVTWGTDVKRNSSNDYVADPSFTLGMSPIQNGTSTPDCKGGPGCLGEGTPKSERSADMFCDDIFGEYPVGTRKMGKGDGLQIERSGLHDNWDDAEGYYSYRFGELLDGHYEVIASNGKGVFSTVVRARDLKAGKCEPEEVAVKIIRNNETMYKAGQEELKILGKLAATDPEDKRHCVR